MSCLGAALAPLAAANGIELDGVWIASAGPQREVVWQVDSGRLRIDGRPADLEIRSDSLIVRFDPAPGSGPGADRETAVYRFLASSSLNGFQRLFVYGFDLGSHGLYFDREAPGLPPLPEDAAPPVPAAAGTQSPMPPSSGPQPTRSQMAGPQPAPNCVGTSPGQQARVKPSGNAPR